AHGRQVDAERADVRGRGRARAGHRDHEPLIRPAVRQVPGRGVAGAGRLGDLGVEVEQVAGGGPVVVGAADIDPDLIVRGAGDRGPAEGGPAGTGDHGRVGRGAEGELAGGGRGLGRRGEDGGSGAGGVDGPVDVELPEGVSVPCRAGGAVDPDVAAGAGDVQRLDAALTCGGRVDGVPGRTVVGEVDAV